MLLLCLQAAAVEYMSTVGLRGIKGMGVHLQAKYEEALRVAPEGAKKQRAVYYANLAACHLRTKHFEDAVQDSNAALELEPEYIKALLRRAAAYEELDDLEHALADNTKVGWSYKMLLS